MAREAGRNRSPFIAPIIGREVLNPNNIPRVISSIILMTLRGVAAVLAATSVMVAPAALTLGVRFIEGLDRLGIKKPGRYSILVEYHSPISTTDVDRKDFWSKEDGALRSNLVWIEVVR